MNSFEAAETIAKYLPSATIYFVTVIHFLHGFGVRHG